ncbi:MAG: hypothetical protein A2Y38_19775 [Spirochaetes bacterium GWB1_59_5]|nr:MAG: hypothetical protein A2Y38_19775 [Spirochaetes bacterium GWB1_59_5]
MDKIFELLASMQRLQAVDLSDNTAAAAALREAAAALDAAVAVTNLDNQQAVNILTQATAGIFLAARGVSDEIHGGTFLEAVEVLVTPKATPKARGKRSKPA